MSQENVELARSLYESVERGDYERPFEVLDTSIIWDVRLHLPDLARFYRGHDGIREFWRQWLAAWGTLEFKLLSVEDRGDLVIFEVKQRNRGRASGVAVDFHYFQAFTVRDGKVTAVYTADTKAEDLEAAGLSESAMSQGNVEIDRRATENLSQSGDPLWELLDPEIEWIIDP